MLEQYRDEVSSFQEAIGRERYSYTSGQKMTLELLPIYDRFADLFHPDIIQRLKLQYERTDEYFETERQGLSLLRTFAEEAFTAFTVRELSENIAAREAQAVIQLDEERVPFHRVPEVLATQPDPLRRQDLTGKWIDELGRMNEWRQERRRRTRAGAHSLGYDCYWQMLTRRRGRDLSSVSHIARRMLKETDSLYHRCLAQWLPKTIGKPVDKADRADVEYFIQLNQLSQFFPRGGPIPVYHETLRTLGIDYDLQKNVEYDFTPRPTKHPQAFCIPIKIPEEIRLSISLRGGPHDFQTVMQAGGQAQRYVWTSPSLPVEFKYAGDPAVTEGTALLFRSLLLDPLWLAEMLQIRNTDNLLMMFWLKKLFSVRRSAARLLVEQAVHSAGEIAAASRLYAALLTDATGFKHYAEEALYALDSAIPSMHSLRGWLLEAQLRESLKTRFGRRWWGSAKAADSLIDIWKTGERFTAEELATSADLGSLSPDQVIHEFHEVLT